MNRIPEALAGYDPDTIRAAAAKTLNTRWDEYANHDPYFAVWLKLIDTTIRTTLGVGLFDLPDATYRDWYDDGLTPDEATELALHNDELYKALFD